jgi:hypothetical protein
LNDQQSAGVPSPIFFVNAKTSHKVGETPNDASGPLLYPMGRRKIAIVGREAAM